MNWKTQAKIKSKPNQTKPKAIQTNAKSTIEKTMKFMIEMLFLLFKGCQSTNSQFA